MNDSICRHLISPVLLKDLPVPAHMDRCRVLKLTQESKLKEDKGKADKVDEGSSGMTASHAKGASGRESLQRDK